MGKEDAEPPSELKQWNHLENIIDQTSGKDDISAGLLIGADWSLQGLIRSFQWD